MWGTVNEASTRINPDYLPFYITAPGESDILFSAVAIALVGVVIGFGALYFTIQAIPDRMVKGAGKAQMQVVGLLGLISLFTMNNLYWIAAILLAAVRIPDLLTPLTQIAQSLRGRAEESAGGSAEVAGTPASGAEANAAAQANEEAEPASNA